MAWTLTKLCFPPTKKKKLEHKKICMMERIIHENPEAFFDSHFPNARFDEPSQNIKKATPHVTSELSWLHRVLNRIDNRVFTFITRNWDTGENEILTQEEIKKLMYDITHPAP